MQQVVGTVVATASAAPMQTAQDAVIAIARYWNSTSYNPQVIPFESLIDGVATFTLISEQ
ncbi:hypothetical protein OK016_27410 [Vibrio chagasii]|nr:hypothetical protein [Vibrio chagasii]